LAQIANSFADQCELKIFQTSGFWADNGQTGNHPIADAHLFTFESLITFLMWASVCGFKLSHNRTPVWIAPLAAAMTE